MSWEDTDRSESYDLIFGPHQPGAIGMVLRLCRKHRLIMLAAIDEMSGGNLGMWLSRYEDSRTHKMHCIFCAINKVSDDKQDIQLAAHRFTENEDVSHLITAPSIN